MADWEVKVVTESNYIKTIRVDNCFTRQDAETQALSSTGAVRVVNSTPKKFDDEPQVIENNYYVTQPETYQEEVYQEDDKHIKNLDKLEEEMFDLMCRIAMEEGRELPTISEFYEWLKDND